MTVWIPLGLGDGFKNQEMMEFEILMFKIMKSGFCYTNPEQIDSRKFLNLLCRHISLINNPRMTIIILMYFPMFFL